MPPHAIVLRKIEGSADFGGGERFLLPLSSDHSVSKDGRIILIIYCCIMNYYNTKLFKIAIIIHIVLVH